MPESNIYGHDVMLRAASHASYPPTPALRAQVLARMGESTRGAASGTRLPALRVMSPLAALSGAAVIMVVMLVAPASRSAVADFFGIEGSRINVLPTTAASTPLPTPQDIDEEATLSTLGQAAIVAGFTPGLPDGEAPSSVYTVAYGDEHGIIARFAEFDLWQAGAGRFEGYFGKGVPSDAVVTDLVVAGVPGTWITGGPHFVVYYDATGEAQSEPRTVERNTLIWRTDAALYRIETFLPLDEALEVAEGLP